MKKPRKIWQIFEVKKLDVKSFIPNQAIYLNFFYDHTGLTGGPPLTQKSLTWFPIQWFLAYVRANWDFHVSRGTHCSPTNTNFM